MDISTIVGLVTKGVGQLMKLVPLWLGAKTDEERAAIAASAQKAVDALDAHFAEKDAHDKAEQDKLQAEIDAAKAAGGTSGSGGENG